jgi:hypothetical protein
VASSSHLIRARYRQIPLPYLQVNFSHHRERIRREQLEVEEDVRKAKLRQELASKERSNLKWKSPSGTRCSLLVFFCVYQLLDSPLYFACDLNFHLCRDEGGMDGAGHVAAGDTGQGQDGADQVTAWLCMDCPSAPAKEKRWGLRAAERKRRRETD